MSSNGPAAALIAEMQAYYERRADVYDASMGYDRLDVVDSLQPVIEALRQEMRERTVLEIACGPGFWTERLADSARFILASDYNESTLAKARTKSIDPARVSFVRADAYDMSSIDGTFTGAFAVDWLSHVPSSRLQDFLDGFHGRLVAGGRVAFCDQTPRPASITGMHDAEGNHLQERILPDGSRHRVIKHFFSDADLRTAFARHTDAVTIRRFREQRRVIVSYTIGVR